MASNSQAGWVFVLSAGVLGVVVAGAILPGWSLRGLEISRHVAANSRVGEDIEVTAQIRNSSGSTRSMIEGTDDFLSGCSFFVEEAPPGAAVAVHYKLEARRRGVYSGGEIAIASGAPFGIRTARRRVTVDSPIIVHPGWIALPNFPLLESASTPHEILHERRRGSGMEFYGIREYRSGDSLRHVHWRSSARTGRLYVREFEEHFASRLGVLIDASSKIGKEPQTTFEDAVACAASIVIYALETGHPAQVFCDSRQGIAHLFEPTRLQALDWLAGLEADGRRGLARVAKDMVGEIHPRSTNALIFAATKPNAVEAREAASILQARSSRVIAVILSASSYSDRDTRALKAEEEQALADGLASQRVIVYRVLKGMDLAQCLKESLLV